MKTCYSIAALLVVLVGLPFSSSAQVPLVYAVENTGAGYPTPPLPTLASLPTILPLPDPFTWANDPKNMGGTRSTNFVDWSHHHAEVEAQLENYEIGYRPPVDPTNIFASISGSGTTRTLTVRVTNVVAGVARTLTLTCAIGLPASSGTFPAIIGMNSPNGSISLGGRAIATITYLHDQVTTYNNPQNSNPYYALYAPPYAAPSPYPANIDITTTGQYSAWSWGVSRIIDGLYKLSGNLGGGVQIDLQHIGVTGCSYAGKMALFCGAFDERIALTIPQESGGGGAPNWRYSYQIEPTGTVEGLAQTSSQWFEDAMFNFGGANTAKLPEDHHELLAMVAPRALFATGNPDGAVWLSNPSCYVSCKAVEQVYNTFGIGDRFGYNINGGKPHCSLTADVIADVGAFLDKFLLGLTNVNTITNRHVPSTYSSIDYARWTAWWGTTNAVFPYVGRLSLSLPAGATEGDGTLAGQGLVSLSPTPTNVSVTVNLTSGNPDKVTVPDSVVIPAGQSNAMFDLTINDNSILDGDVPVTITANSPVSNNGPQNQQITIRDNEITTMSVTLPASASESAGLMANVGSISMGAAAGTNITISLISSDPLKLASSTVVIPKGQTSAAFSVYVYDSQIIGGSENVSVTTHVTNWTNGVASMTILFDDPLPGVMHFAWSAVPSPQMIGGPFPVTITAQDGANNPLDYRLPVTLSALIAGNASGMNTILNSPSPEQSLTDGQEFVLGYSFTPSTNLKVTDVLSYFGDNVSIWTANGQLLASQNVVSVPGTWVDTSLPSPLVLPAGATYLIMVHENGVQYYSSQSLPATFPDGTINQSWWDWGNGFPTQTDGAQWYFVDLRYATDFVSVPVSPGATANFSNGTWSGNIMALQAATNMILQASAGVGHFGTSNPFNVLSPPRLVITALSNSVVLSWPVAAAGYNLQQASSLANWADVPGTPAVVGDRCNVTNILGANPIFFRLRKP